MGLSLQKILQASVQRRPDTGMGASIECPPQTLLAKASVCLVFIDETSTNTRLTKRTGWPQKGHRYRTHAPVGAWKTQTFIS